MTPYYEHAGITIYLADCRDVLDEWEGLRTQSFDLLLTDPPYGILANGSAAVRRALGNKSDGEVAWDIRPSMETIARLIAITKIQMIWGGLHFQLPPTFGYFVWDKQIDGLNFGECEVCWTPLRFAPRIFRYRAVDIDGGRVHPTQKPEALMRWCIGRAGEPRTILDPFMGSGTTLVAAKRLGRVAVGIEGEERYCEIAVRRLAQEVLPLDAFEASV
jgi:DNA modification methylase